MNTQEILKSFSLVMDELREIISVTGEKQLNATPESGGWSIAQLAEHLLKSYDSVEVMKGNVLPTERAPDEKVEEIKAVFLDFESKYDSPPEIIPSTGYINKSDLLEGLESRIAQLRDIILMDDMTLMCTDFAIPEFGTFSRLEWIYLNIVHTQRHVYQMKSILDKQITLTV